MPLPVNISQIKKSLKLTLPSEHFVVHYGLRNPREGRGLGSHGVRDRVLILTYLHALENLYAAITAKPWEREPPVTGGDKKTHVYVFNSGGPFTAYDSRKIPYIVLPSRSNEPTTQAELHRAASEAVHEATHLFNYSQRPFHDKFHTKAWEWFDEGLAVLMEMLVGAGNPDYFRFLMDWIDSPEMPLDHPAGKYQAGMFVRYLSKRLGLKFVNDVWVKSAPEEKPLEALERLMPDGQRFLSADSAVRDIFASGYCIDPYFLWEHASVSLAPDVFVRYGERAVTESLTLPASNGQTINDELDHLACRYYRFYLKGGTHFEVKLTVNDACAVTPLKAEVAVVTTDMRRTHIEALCPAEAVDVEEGCLSCVVGSLDSDEIDHIVLIVSNCGTGATLNGNGGGDDGKRFRITASVY